MQDRIEFRIDDLSGEPTRRLIERHLQGMYAVPVMVDVVKDAKPYVVIVSNQTHELGRIDYEGSCRKD